MFPSLEWVLGILIVGLVLGKYFFSRTVTVKGGGSNFSPPPNIPIEITHTATTSTGWSSWYSPSFFTSWWFWRSVVAIILAIIGLYLLYVFGSAVLETVSVPTDTTVVERIDDATTKIGEGAKEAVTKVDEDVKKVVAEWRQLLSDPEMTDLFISIVKLIVVLAIIGWIFRLLFYGDIWAAAIVVVLVIILLKTGLLTTDWNGSWWHTTRTVTITPIPTVIIDGSEVALHERSDGGMETTPFVVGKRPVTIPIGNQQCIHIGRNGDKVKLIGTDGEYNDSFEADYVSMSGKSSKITVIYYPFSNVKCNHLRS